MPGSSAAREAPLRLAVSDEPYYSIPVEDAGEALRLVEEFFGRVGVKKNKREFSEVSRYASGRLRMRREG